MQSDSFIEKIDNIDQQDSNTINFKTSESKRSTFYLRGTIGKLKRRGPKFRRLLKFIISYLDKRPSLFFFCHFLIGFIFILIPLTTTIIFPLLPFNISLNFYIFPYIISASLIWGFLLFHIIIRFDDNYTNGSIIPSYERSTIFKTFHCLIIFTFVIWFLKTIDHLLFDIPFLRDKFLLTNKADSETNEINFGMFSINVVFISIFGYWDDDANKTQTQTQLGYIKFAPDFIQMFYEDCNYIVNCLITLTFIYIVKIALFKTKESLCYLIECLMVYIECILFKLTNFSGEKHIYYNDNQTGLKFIEMFPLIIIVMCECYLCFKRYIIGILKRKYLTYISFKSNFINLIFLVLSFVFTCGGLIFLFIANMILLFKLKINHELHLRSIEVFRKLIRNGFVFYSMGSVFYFGNFVFKLLFKPIIIGEFPVKTKEFYIRVKKKRKINLDLEPEQENEVKISLHEKNLNDNGS